MADAKGPDALRPGDAVGSWRIEGYAGRGSYGLVYRARRVGVPCSEPVALKVAAFAHDPRFMREGGVLSRFHHPSIPRLLHRGLWIAGPHAAHPFLVLEWIRGWPLYEWARLHRPTVRQVLQVMAQVAGALDALHQEECLHRDVKGDNILVEPEGRAVLMDYGSSTWAGAPPLTETLMPPNTPEYRSPEALRFQWRHWRTQGARYEARPADDLYALGVTAYRLVTRAYPPPGTDPEELKQHLEAPSPKRLPPQALNERVVPELAVLIERMLADEPRARGLARDAGDAAEAGAAQPGAALDVPLWDPEPPRDGPGPLPAWRTPAPDSKHPAVEIAPRPASVRTEPHPSPRALRAALVATMLVLGVMGSWKMLPRPREPQVEHPAVVLNAERAPDAGTTGLGDGGVTARVTTEEVPAPVEAVATEMPKQPLPNQRRAPCRRGEVEINGGCWAQWTTNPPPCNEGSYEWNGVCYLPLYKQTLRVPNSGKPQ